MLKYLLQIYYDVLMTNTLETLDDSASKAWNTITN